MSTDEPLPRILPLENGDHLSREEFWRRYEASPEIKKAELLDGIVYVQSPVSLVSHGEPHANLVTWFGIYDAFTPGVDGGVNSTVILDSHNVPQPDGVLLIDPKCDGQVVIDKDGYIIGAPEMVLEISATRASIDMHDKLQAYRRNGVQEYIVWRAFDQEVDWFYWVQGMYQRLIPDAEGILKSKVFPGLWLDAPALLGGDLPKVHEVLHRGLASPEHAAFVAKLQAAMSAS